MPRPVREEQQDLFVEQVKHMLHHIKDAQWLGEHSPLATPYMLGWHLHQHSQAVAIDAHICGTTLQKLAQEALAALEPSYEKHLQLRFFEGKSREQREEAMAMSRNPLTTHLRVATRHFADALLRVLRPALRTEAPRRFSALIGREQEYAQCLRTLQQSHTVTISGPAGVGKTTLATFLFAEFHQAPTCWITLRQGINDSLESIAFALGHTLGQYEVSHLWRQLIAKGIIDDPETLLALLRYDIHVLQEQMVTPILCFDEIDTLRPSEVPEHNRIISFIEGLHHLMPLLLIGQYPLIDGDVVCSLTGLSAESVITLLTQHSISPSTQDVKTILHATRGNPRMLEFIMTLHTKDSTLAETIYAFRQAPSLESLLDRVLRRLTEDDLSLLLDLCPFRRPCPAAEWPPAMIDTLIRLHLVQTDTTGGVEILPTFRDVLLRELPQEGRQEREEHAAWLRLKYGEYTEAAYHLVAAHRPAFAVRLWHKYMKHEIEQGQGYVARELFGTIALDHLDQTTQELVLLIRSELHKLIGAYDLVQRNLASVKWSQPTSRYQAQRLQGDVAELQDQYDVALRHYESGLRTVQHLLIQSGRFRKSRAWSLHHRNEHDESWQEAQRALCEIEYVQSCMLVDRGQLIEAQAHGRRALELARVVNMVEMLANIHDLFSEITEKQGDFATAELHLAAAEELYRQTKRASALADLHANRANLYNLMGRHSDALELAHAAYEQSRRLNSIWGQAVAANARAEALLGLDQLDDAEQAALEVIATEDEHTRPDGLRVLAEVMLKRGQLPRGERYIREAIAAADETGNGYLEAYAWRTLGKIYAAGNDLAAARDAFSRARDMFSDQQLDNEVARTRQAESECGL
jgi:tetratricopeptide (TPR) repeat protein